MSKNKSPWGIDVLESDIIKNRQLTAAKDNELNQHFASCFNTPSGIIVLDYLKECTINQPCFVPLNSADTTTIVGYIREGQNSIVRNIIDRINIIKNK